MNTFIQFEPIGTCSSQENLDRFIIMCSDDLTVFGSDLPFDKNVWDITLYAEQKAKTKRTAVVFTTHKFASVNKSGRKATHENITPMQEPFLSFAKSYFRYRFGLNSFKSPGNLLEPLRIIEEALIEISGAADTNAIDNYVLDKAANITKTSYSKERAYRIGGTLENIGKFLSIKRLTKIQIDWKNPIKRPSGGSRVGKEADDKRNKKMPSEAGLEAIPEIFNKAITPYEKLTTSLIALLICAPNRINEVFLLPYNCEVTQKDKDGAEQYGIRWFPSKGAAPMIKWIIPSMVHVAQEAINRIKTVTKQAREVAKWYENNPGMLYLPKELEYLRNTVLSTTEVSYIIFGKYITDNNLARRKQTTSTWINQKSVPYSRNGNKLVVHFSDLEKVVLALLPERFPYLNEEIGLKFSEALILQMTNEYHSKKGTLIPTINAVNMDIVTDALKNRGNLSSLFDRFGYTESDGSPIKMTSHQFRHYLNTLAQKGGLSQLDIAKWSGRIDIHQNQVYDHVSADEMLEMVREAIGDENAMKGPLSYIEDIKKKVVISRDEFARLKVRTAHVTEVGVCIHDFTMTPCEHHGNCMGCIEHLCMKGDKVRTDRIKEMKKDTEGFLITAKNAQKESYFGANRWVESHSKFLEILKSTCDILEDPTVPDGSLIQLSNIQMASPIEQACIRRNEMNTIEHDDTDSGSVNLYEMKKLLEDMGDKK